jgi:alcohol dehydrogenase
MTVRGRSKNQFEEVTLTKTTPSATNGRSSRTHTSTMQALVYLGVGKKALEERPKPEITAATDAIVRITQTTISASDLQTIKSDVAKVRTGRILGHEGVGIIESVGAAVTAFEPGDRVVISSISACGSCASCRKLMYSQCTTGGLLLGDDIDGTQAEFVRIPYADTSLYGIPKGADEEAAVLLSNVLPSGFECGVLNGKIQPGGTVAIVGAGPIGLAALITAQFYEPAEIIVIDLDDSRLAVAKGLGATAVVNSLHCKAGETVLKLTNGRGVDTVIEAVGIPAAFELAESIAAPGGTLASIGTHAASVDLHLETLWNRNVTITTRLVDTVSTPMLLGMLLSDKLDLQPLITHRFKFDRILDAYETVAHSADTGALKVLIEG